MFTGIITDLGRIESIDGPTVVIASSYDPASIDIGASIACDGCCLTVTKVTGNGDGAVFTVEVSNETYDKTTLGTCQTGTQINLERALGVGAELGGHIVTGHVDGVATITDIVVDGISKRFSFEAPSELAKFIAPKGSAALAGTSLTINEVNGNTFGVNLIPHTLEVTNWGRKQPGDKVNLEVDLLARYVARLNEYKV